MKNLLASLKARILYPLIPDPIESKKDYILRLISLIIGVICFIGGLIAAIIMPKDSILQIWIFWGLFCAIPFLPKILKSVFRAKKISYKVGKAATEREYVEINHMGGGQYRATHRKQDDGELFGIMGSIFAFLAIGVWYELAGPVLLGFKTYKTAKVIMEYKNSTVEITDEMIER